MATAAVCSLPMAEKKEDMNGNAFFEITDKRRVGVSKFRNKARVDIREFY